MKDPFYEKVKNNIEEALKRTNHTPNDLKDISASDVRLYFENLLKDNPEEREIIEKVLIIPDKMLVETVSSIRVENTIQETENKIRKVRGCSACPNSGHFELKECPDAYTEVSQYCGMFDHDEIETR